ncbi:calcium-activated potassium channel subunit beta-4 [Antrostomus carolinensis]|uniref:calcium-activated potassium channel subunit beta-4 n=1 Tax=Antrostomus carolinensis TaxID=279965 RepID=UPI00052917CC|nr:calcium-activated potassium channel subunit beta-4 [Antrostomus carolinensis]
MRHIGGRWVDRAESALPLGVFVPTLLTLSSYCTDVFVHWESGGKRKVIDASKCSYIPPCARDDQENSENVTYKQKYWKEKVGSQPFTCYFNQHLRPDDVMLKRTHDETVLLHCFLWPLVTFLVGVLIVVLTICAKSLAVRAEAIKKKKHL